MASLIFFADTLSLSSRCHRDIIMAPPKPTEKKTLNYTFQDYVDESQLEHVMKCVQDLSEPYSSECRNNVMDVHVSWLVLPKKQQV